MVPQFFRELLFHPSEDVDNVIGKSAHVKDELEGICSQYGYFSHKKLGESLHKIGATNYKSMTRITSDTLI